MSPKEKATELVYETFRKAIGVSRYELLRDPENFKRSKKCALICVDEILNELIPYDFRSMEVYREQKDYWNEVKEEIQNTKPE